MWRVSSGELRVAGPLCSGLATEHPHFVSAVILAAASASKVAADVIETPFHRGRPDAP
jgi:hypothetical protein